MKKSFVAVLFLLAVPFSASAAFDANLGYGAKGEAVVELQEFLIEQGVLNIPTPTGNFYSVTLAAVKKFQIANGIRPISGYFGPISRGVANNLLVVSQDEGNAVVEAPKEVTRPAQNQPASGVVIQPVTSQVTIDCTPTLVASLTRDNGTVETGIGFIFNGTSTLPTGCSIDTQVAVDLQTPTVKYRGTLGGWAENGNHAKIIDGGFVYWQGWGMGANKDPKGSFIWTVGATSTEVKI